MRGLFRGRKEKQDKAPTLKRRRGHSVPQCGARFGRFDVTLFRSDENADDAHSLVKRRFAACRRRFT